ncbi:hypothetical protein U27_01504 [Candidatus Vecturithrix granuli]|uniref:Uncharacterized protein n=1 Tax=Vecturithrix granuli TaxID=1499967 RepID=A0A081CAJ8_VECG1|nr:hypothetical protein U27_01504 [Candidatus Vecturithrix granuli]
MEMSSEIFMPLINVKKIDIIGNTVCSQRFSVVSDVFRNAEAFTTSQIRYFSDSDKKALPGVCQVRLSYYGKPIRYVLIRQDAIISHHFQKLSASVQSTSGVGFV